MAKRNREPKRTRRSRSNRDYSDKESERNETTSRDIEERVHKNYFLNFNVNQKFKLNDTHESFTNMAMNNKTKMSIIDGRAGSGKTYLSVYAALQALQKQQVEEIVYIRSVVESASKGMGFLPGEADEKFLPWMYPLFDKLQELLDPTAAKKLVEAGVIRGMPVNFVRGATFRNACVIIDEAQIIVSILLLEILCNQILVTNLDFLVSLMHLMIIFLNAKAYLRMNLLRWMLFVVRYLNILSRSWKKLIKHTKAPLYLYNGVLKIILTRRSSYYR